MASWVVTHDQSVSFSLSPSLPLVALQERTCKQVSKTLAQVSCKGYGKLHREEVMQLLSPSISDHLEQISGIGFVSQNT